MRNTESNEVFIMYVKYNKIDGKINNNYKNICKVIFTKEQNNIISDRENRTFIMSKSITLIELNKIAFFEEGLTLEKFLHNENANNITILWNKEGHTFVHRHYSGQLITDISYVIDHIKKFSKDLGEWTIMYNSVS